MGGGASLMLYLRGIVTQFHDIDIMVAECDAERVEQAICRIGKEQLPNGTAQYEQGTSSDLRLMESMSTSWRAFVIVLTGRITSARLLPEDITGDPYSKRRECPAALCRALGGSITASWAEMQRPVW